MARRQELLFPTKKTFVALRAIEPLPA